MTRLLSDLEWRPLTAEGMSMMEEVAARQWNETARKYGAMEIPLKQKTVPAGRFCLLDADAVTRAGPVKWRVQGVLPESGIAAIFGPSGSAKSFLALDLMLSVASGRPWFGRRTKPCPVVYVCLEGEAGLAKRILAYRSRGTCEGNVHFLIQPCSLMRPEDVRELARAIRQSDAGGGITVIDTLSRAAPGLDENSSVDMGNAIKATTNLQKLIGGLMVLIHHTGKDAGKGMRGHSSLFAALDAAIEVRRTGERREWIIAKSKDGEDGQAHAFRLDTVDLGSDDEGERISSCVIRAGGETMPSKPLTAAQQQGMDSFLAVAARNLDGADPAPKAHVAEWRDEFNRVSTADSVEAKRKAFARVRAQLVELDRLVVSDDVYRLPMGFGPVGGHRT